ncbi:MAG: SDR family NAD(P)-dependent oxidoreductase [Hamadaea sp.]|uniref:type I polyketide synthase n=1 Tax=Hamadaea sp. TaxID=2024425 RepID=UPI001849043C|nr:type I polyketide synthase [Hamadaea sp.]NUR69256.1 SDR family NAD(P)-dependent oxidoreductase [Hamadaea sp.]NUT21118.1 SDR family NAD(P)-dependent oxidoreductase [Hamadaea sp.]
MADEDQLLDYLKRTTATLRETRARLADLERRTAGEPIAIVGMACRYPGGVDSPEDLWRLVMDEVDAVADFPTDRGWDTAGVYDPQPGKAGRNYARQGAFLYDAGSFDAGLFGIPPRDALTMDPQHRLLLEASWEALERARIDPTSLKRSATGVFAGLMYHDYPDSQGVGSLASGRVSYTLGLEGPSMTIDTACSSSLVALDLAVASLRSGECSLALAGGVAVMATMDVFLEFSQQQALSPDGRCRSFAAQADGTGWGEGVGVLVVERLSDAERNGHPVLAVVRGIATNQDGASSGLTAPNGPAQERLIRHTLDLAGLTGSDVDVVEAHGTGTKLGDPIEAQALLNTYGQDRPAGQPLWLGSMKSNVGHTQAAAAVGGIIKMVLALSHGVLPKTLHAEEPTPRVDWSEGDIQLLTSARPWPDLGRPRRAAVSSFGVSGTNSHVILEQAPAPVRPTVPARALPITPWTLSAKTPAALRGQASRLRHHIIEYAEADPVDVGLSLVRTRAALDHRAVVVGASRDELLAGLTALAGETADSGVVTGVARGEQRTVFVFPGVGSAWPGMAVDLLDTSPVFAARMAECAEALTPLVDWDLMKVVRESSWQPVDRQQPVLWAIMVSLAALWQSHGVRPSAVAGHSQGEIAAACVAGVLTLADAAKVVVLRSKSLLALTGHGGMLSVVAAEDWVRERLEPYGGRLDVSAVNGPKTVVVSGNPEDLRRFERELAAARVMRWAVPDVDFAAHTAQVDALEDELNACLAGIEPQPSAMPFYSTVTGGRLDTAELDAAYWYRNLRSTVEFERTVRALLADGYGAFLECSTHPILRPGLSEIFDESSAPATALGTLVRDDGSLRRFTTSLAQAHVCGVPVDWTATFAEAEATVVDLPTYAFDRERYWLDATAGEVDAAALGQRPVDHPLLGAAVTLGDGSTLVTGRMATRTHPWLADHSALGTRLLAATAFVELAIRAGDEAGCARLAELTLLEPLVLPDEEPVRLQVRIGLPDASGGRPVDIHAAVSDQDWIRHATGVLVADREPAGFELTEWPPAGALAVDLTGAYDGLRADGYDYGPAFQGLRAVWRRGDEVFAEAVLPEVAGLGGFGLHPALLDAALHSVMVGGEPGETRLPYAWADVALHAAGATQVRVRVAPGSATGLSVQVADSAGRPVLSAASLATRPAQAGPGPLYAVEWFPTPLPDASVDWAYLEDVTEDGPVPAVVVLRSTQPDGDVPEALRTTASRVLQSIQDWQMQDRFADANLVVLTEGAHATESLALAAVAGLVRVAQSENPGRVLLVDTDGRPASAEVLGAVFAGDEPEYSVRDGELWIPRLRRLDPSLAMGESRREPDPSGTVLVTGGTSGLGRLVARHLVTEHGVRHLLLVSRSGPQAPGADELIAELSGLGAAVTVAACDVAERTALAELLDVVDPAHPLTGVVHAAGVLDDGVIGSLNPERLDTVLRPKAYAAWHLHDLTKDHELAFFVMLSSVSGLLGAPGQGNYALANTFLDALAAYRADAGLAATSMVLGLWDTETRLTGVLDRADHSRMSRHGITALPVRDGLALFDAALRSGRPRPVVARLRLNIGSGAPAMLRALPGAAARRTAANAAGLVRPLGTLTGPTLEKAILSTVREQVARILGYASTAVIDPGSNFRDLGFDSLTALELRDALATAVGVRLPATLVWDYPTVAAVVAHLRDATSGVRTGVRVDAPTPRADTDEPIAIVGMACRFPGGVSSPEDLWQLVVDGRDVASPFPDDRGWPIERLYDERPGLPGRISARGGGFLEGAAEFDPTLFGISPNEALAMDPQQRLLLETSLEAFERAGLDVTSLHGSNTGVFAGLMYHDYPGSTANGSIAAGLVSYTFGLQGPCATVDTACSSSLVALHWAVRALRAGECDLALAGGVTVMATPESLLYFSAQQGLSADGRCRSFAESAAGTGLSEGVGVLLVERLSDAQRNGHDVLAVVRGSAVNSDGASNGLTAPSGPAQQRVILRALADAGLSTSEVDAVEAHGTGTKLGDPIEAQALLATYGQDRTEDQPLLLGSLKSNLGHTQAAAGVAGVIKMVQSLRHGVLPVSLHADEPTSAVDWSAGHVRLLTETVDWPDRDRPRHAAVSSFGLSGTNAHVVLEQAPPADAAPVEPAPERVLPWVVSAESPAALRAQVGALLDHVRADPQIGALDVAYSLATRRAVRPHRAVAVGRDQAALTKALASLADREAVRSGGGLAFLFTGQGTQRLGMGRELHAAFPVFAEALAAVAQECDWHLDRPLLEVMWGDDAELLDQTRYAQPAIFAVEVALYRLVESWGLRPDYLGGHSIGELTAAYASGVFSLADAVALVVARGRLMQALPPGGAMVAIEATPQEVEPLLTPGIGIAAVNGPRAVVISGDTAEVAAISDQFPDRKRTRLRVSHAFHSPLMEPMLAEFAALADGIVHHEPAVPIVSALTGTVAGADELGAAGFWARHVRETVRFRDTVRFMADAGTTAFLELGPDAALSAMGSQCVDDPTTVFAAALRRDRDEEVELISAIGRVHERGAHVDWAAFFAGRGARPVSLPTYQFQRRRYWLSPRDGGELFADTAVDEQPEVLAAGEELRRRVAECPADERAGVLIGVVRDQVATALGFDSADDVPPDRVLAELGFDSLAAVELSRRLGTLAGTQLPPSLIYDYPTASAVSVYLATVLAPPGDDPARLVLGEVDRLEQLLATVDGDRAVVTARLEALLRGWRDAGPADGEVRLDYQAATDDELFKVLDDELGIG